MVPYTKGQFRFGVINSKRMKIEYESMWKPLLTKSRWHFTEARRILLFTYAAYDKSLNAADHRYINKDTETRGCLDFIKRKER